MPAAAGYSNAEALAVGALIQTQLAGAKMHLFNSAIPFNPDTPLATLVASEATFPGYVAVVATPVGVTLGSLGGFVVWLAQSFFLATAGTETEYGWFLTDSTTTILIAWGTFDSPIPLTQDGDGIVLQTGLQGLADNVIEQAVNTITQ